MTETQPSIPAVGQEHVGLLKDAQLAARVNLVSGVAKMTLGFMSGSPVLVSDGAHDFGDTDIYRADGRAIDEQDPEKKAQRKIRAAYKLGGYAIVGTAAEVLVEHNLSLPDRPWLALAGGMMSVATNLWVHRRFNTHQHHEADEVQGHARTDLASSLVTIGASAASFLLPSAALIGSATHIGLYTRQALVIRRKHHPKIVSR